MKRIAWGEGALGHGVVLVLALLGVGCSDDTSPVPGVIPGDGAVDAPIDGATAGPRDATPTMDSTIPGDSGPADAQPDVDAAPVDAALDAASPGPRPCVPVTVTAVPTSVRDAFSLDPFYTKYVDVDGLPLLSSGLVDDRAFAVAADILRHMLEGRPDVREQLITFRVRIGIMAESEVTTDMPEHSDLDEVFPATDWDTRARGLGATLARPLTSVGEENLLGLVADRYDGESILVHEFAHTFFALGVARVAGGAAMRARLTAAYDNAIALGLFAETYASTDEREYWAEGVQDWFDTNIEAIPPNGIHGHVDTREELWEHDPTLATLVRDALALEDGWRPLCTLPLP